MLVFRTLQLIVPLAGAVAIAALPSAEQIAAQTQLRAMQAIVAPLPATAETRAENSVVETTDSGDSYLRPRARPYGPCGPSSSNTSSCTFGGLRRVHAPAGDLLWVCENHDPDYDPVLPVVQ